MTSANSLAFSNSEGFDDAHGLVDAERNTLPWSPECTQAPSLDAQLMADAFDLARPRPEVAREMSWVDAGRLRPAVIHNAFWVAGKVPSLNDLLDAKGTRQPVIRSIIMRKKPAKRQSGGEFDLYNDIKQDWTQRTIKAVGAPFVRVQQCYFGYVVVEETLRRDPSNIISSAIKFIEDGLIKAGVIPNDGWGNVLGIRPICIHRPGRDPGVYVVMSDEPLEEARLVMEYEEHNLG
jgi:hypothetical protein